LEEMAYNKMSLTVSSGDTHGRGKAEVYYQSSSLQYPRESHSTSEHTEQSTYTSGHGKSLLLSPDDEYKSGILSRIDTKESFSGTSKAMNVPLPPWSKAQSENAIGSSGGSSGVKLSRSSGNFHSRSQTSRITSTIPSMQQRTRSSKSVWTRGHSHVSRNTSNSSRTYSKGHNDDTFDTQWFPQLLGKQITFQVQRLRAEDHRQPVDQDEVVIDADNQKLEILSESLAIWEEFIEHGITSLMCENQLLEQLLGALEEKKEEKDDEVENFVDDYLLHTKHLQLQEVSLTIARENLSEAFSLPAKHFKNFFLDEYIKFCTWTIDSGVRIRSHQNTVVLKGTERHCSIPKHNPYTHLLFITEQNPEELPEEFFFWSEQLKYAVNDDRTLREALHLHALSLNKNYGYLELEIKPMHVLDVCKMTPKSQGLLKATRSPFLPFDSRDLSFQVLKVNKVHGNSNRVININAKNNTIKIIKKNTDSTPISSGDITSFKWERDAWRGKFTLTYYKKETEKTFIGFSDEGHVRRLHFCLHRFVLDHNDNALGRIVRQDFEFPENFGDSNPQVQKLLKSLEENKEMSFCCRVLHQVMVDQLIEDGWVEHEMIRSFKMLSTSARDKIEKVVHTVIRLLHWVALTLVPIQSSEGYQTKGDQTNSWTDLSLECLGMSPHLSAMLPMLAEALHCEWKRREHGHSDVLLRKDADSSFKPNKWICHFHELDQNGMRYFGTLAVSTLKALLVGHKVQEIEFKTNVE